MQAAVSQLPSHGNMLPRNGESNPSVRIGPSEVGVVRQQQTLLPLHVLSVLVLPVTSFSLGHSCMCASIPYTRADTVAKVSVVALRRTDGRCQ